jgi:sulfane dehydrogenase subunit SoxC
MGEDIVASNVARRSLPGSNAPEPVAGGGLLHRRSLLTGSAALAGAAAVGLPTGGAAALDVPPWMTIPGAPFRSYGMPSAHEVEVQRGVLQPYGDLAPGAGVSMTPLHQLNGTITPNGLHFERHHNGVPDIDPAQHKLLLHGLVARNLTFEVNDLLRYPMTSRICFIECSGNSFFNAFAEPQQMPCGMIHGLVSCSEWTGVSLAALLDEAGVDPAGTWLLAEGADAAGMSRSVPMEKAMDDAIIALYQNGERIRPEQGYPMRLLLPGFEGNMSVKWLRRLKVTDGPTHTKDETSKYTDLMPDGTARQFTYSMGVKSTITHPSFGMAMTGPGFYEISGLAWSGAGSIVKVEVSADGGASWAEAALQDPVLPMSLTRFRLAWDYAGGPALLQSRATDDQGRTQTARAEWAAQYGPGQIYHYNAIQSWQIAESGEISNVFA